LRIVYATAGSPRCLEFYVTDDRQSVPKGATIFTICTRERTIENQDEDLFEAITDADYYTARRLVSEAERLEKGGARPGNNGNFIRRLSTWIAGLLARGRKRAPENQPLRNSPVTRRGRVTSIQQGY
jgi:hypothetical protein